MSIPNWLTKDFLEKLLEDNQDIPEAKINIINHDIIGALPRGNNYLSYVLRITIEYKYVLPTPSESANISLIVKIPLNNSDELAVLSNEGIIGKEIKAYKELLPKMNVVIQANQDVHDLAPKYFKNDIDDVIILEDLSASGYTMFDRKQQLDYEHGVVAMKQLAKFHAASVKLQEKDPDVIKRFGLDPIFNKNMKDEVKEILEPMFGKTHIDLMVEEFGKWPETKKFIGSLAKLRPTIWERLLTSYDIGEGEFAVLNHGDLWTTNLLFKYDHNSKPEATKFIDFQLMRYTSPTLDILTFFYSSIRHDVLKVHFHDFTRIYLEHLNWYLEKYQSSKRLNEKDFAKSLKKREFFGMAQCLTLLAFALAEYDEDTEEIIEEDVSKDETTMKVPVSKFLENKRYRSVCSKHLEDFSKLEWFQNLQ